MSGEREREVIFEVTRVGGVQRIAAIDVATGVEVVVQAPANAALADARMLALRKLERVLKGQAGDKPAPRRPGKLV